jgi:hypothetical protein
MSVTAYSGPVGQYGTVQTSSAGTGLVGLDLEHNDQRAPMFSDLGDMMMDPRVAYSYQPGSGPSRLTLSFYNNVGTVDYIPATANTSALYTSTGVSSGVVGAFTLAAASTANGTYATTIIAPETGNVSGPLIALDSTAAYVTFASAGTMGVWNPGGGTGRCISITTSSSGDAGTFSVAGRDMYGFKMTETLALSQGSSNSSGTTIKGQKAFKYISAITNTSTPTSTGVSIGYTDKFGFPFAVPYVGLNALVYQSSTTTGTAATLSTATVVFASTAATQTSTTPDVRGTFASTSASNGTLRLQMQVTPTASAVAAITSTNVSPLFGGTQFSSV